DHRSSTPVLWFRGRRNLHPRDWIILGPAAAQKAPTIRFVLHRADGIAFDNDNVNAPDRFVLPAALAAIWKNRVLPRHKFSFDEEIAECLVRGVGGRTRQHDFRVARDFDLTRAR